MEIIFNNSRSAGVDEKRLKGLAGRTSRKDLVVSVSFVSRSRIRTLNRKYRKIDRPTDVLSFEMNEGKILGDLMICPAVARSNAKEYGVSYMDEVSRLFVHGLLHLFGYDHGKKMFNREDSILAAG